MKRRWIAILISMVMLVMMLTPVAGTFATEDAATPREATETTETASPSEDNPAPAAESHESDTANESADTSEEPSDDADAVGEAPSAETTPTDSQASEQPPEVENTAEPANTQAPVETEEPIETEEPLETEAPSETEAPVATDEPSESEEPTQPPIADTVEELRISADTDVRYIFADEGSVSFSGSLTGGAYPCTVRFTVTNKDGVAYEEDILMADAGAFSFSYAPVQGGTHCFAVEATDALENMARASADVPVAVHDAESSADWKKSVRGATLTGDWREDLIEIAKTQIGYHESEKNFIIDEDGKVCGYTRYGDWYGSSYEEWCAMFVSFCLEYAEVPERDFPQAANCEKWKDKLSALGAYENVRNVRTDEAYVPQPGDLIFFNWEGEKTAEHVGIVERVTEDTVYTIEGNSERQVRRREYHLHDNCIIGYGNTHLLMEMAGVYAEGEEPNYGTVPEMAGTAVTNKDDVNIRARTSTKSARVGRIADAGTEAALRGVENVDGVSWYLVEYEGNLGFVREDLLDVQAETNKPDTETDAPGEETEESASDGDEPTADTFEMPVPEDVPIVKAITTTNDVNMRAEPTTQSERTGQIATAGTEVTVMSETDTDGEIWRYVEYAGTNGYVRGDLLELIERSEGTEETQTCGCFDIEGARLCAENCACECHATETGLQVEEPNADGWTYGMAECSMHFQVAGATAYQWQYGAETPDGDVHWQDIEGATVQDLSLMTDTQALQYVYRCVATDEGGMQTMSAVVEFLNAELRAWLAAGDVSEEMLARAMNARSLESLVLEDDRLVLVRTGEAVARIDVETHYLIDEATGLVIAVVDYESGIFYPVSAAAAEEIAELKGALDEKTDGSIVED